MQSSDVEVDSVSGGIVEDDDDAAAASASVDPDIPRIPFDYIRLDLSWLPASIADPHQSLLVRQEYKDAIESFEENNIPVVLTGQPGVGKSLFLTYALIDRLIKQLPTIYAPHAYKFYLVRDSGAYQFTGAEMDLVLLRQGLSNIHGRDVPGGNIDGTDKGWILFDSNENQAVPHWYRLYGYPLLFPESF
ncbi:hypothetical protein BKA93DRAFT_738026 [Sparassis latifolia]